MFRNIKFRTKVSIALLLVGFVPFFFIGSVALLMSSRALSQKAFSQLQSMRDVKKTQVEKYFAARQIEMSALIETVATLRQAAFDKLATAQEIKKAQVENYFTQHMKNISVLSKSTTVIDALKRYRVAFGSEEDGKVGGDLYTFLETLFSESFRQFTEEYGYEDLYLITRDGTIVYSVAKLADEGENLLTGRLRDSPLAQGFRNGLKGIAFQDFAPYEISQNEYCAFLVAPIVDQVGKDSGDFIISGSSQETPASALSTEDWGDVFGVVALKIAPDTLNTIVQRREGMGETGETYIVGMQDDVFSYRTNRVVQSGKIGEQITINELGNALSGDSGQEIQPGKTGALEIRGYAPLTLPNLTWMIISTMSLEEAINPRFQEGGDYFTRYTQQYGYEDLLLIHPQGEVFYTVSHHADYGTNILSGMYAESNLGNLVRRVLATRQFDIADFALYLPGKNQPAAFIAQPVVTNERVDVVVAVRLSIDSINAMMLERSGMGATGETYLIGDDLLMRSDTFRDSKYHAVRAAFIEPERGMIDTEASRAALAGETGAKIIQGYTGNRVLSSYTPVRVGNTTWALIAEIDESEAFAAIHALKYVISVLAFLGVVAILSMALVLSHVIVTPLTYLARTASQLAEGDIACNVNTLRRRYVSRDEIGALSRAFEQLIVYIQEMATVATEIAQGNLSRRIQPRSANDVLGQAFVNMSTYLTEMATAATSIATGNLRQAIQPKSEHDVLRNAFKKMAVQLRQNFEKIQQEIAERKHAQEALAEERNLLRTLIDHLPDFVYVKDVECRFLIANNTLARFVGANAPHDLIGKTDADFFLPETAQDLHVNDQMVIRSGEALINHEESIINQHTGETHWILTTKMSLRDSHENIVGLVGIGRDITERVRMEQRMREAERMAYIGKITTSLSHEIRNPLSAIKMNLQILKKNHELADKARRHIDISVREMIRLESMLDEILDFAKPFYPKLSECDLHQLLVGCLELLTVKFEEKQLAVIISFAPDAPTLWADGRKLSQAFINLLLNACDASEPQGRLWVSTRYSADRQNPRIEVLVEDEGDGIPPEQHQHMFEPFFTTKARGTGLGLTNVKRIVETHNGRVNVTNKPDGGMTFCVALPLSKPPHETV